MSASTSRKVVTAAAAASAVIAAVAVAMAHGGKNPPPAAVASTHVPSDLPTAGFIAAKDPVTGQFTAPTADQLHELQAQQAASTRRGIKSTEPVVQRLANGAYVATLDSSYDVASVAVKGADGKITTVCVPAGQVQATLDAAQQRAQTLTTREVLDEK